MKKIYILHGWTYSLEKWKEFVRILKKDGIETKILEIPGLTEKSSEIWDLQKYTKWLKEKISKEKKVILLGHSNGGRIAINFTYNYPEKVEKLILIDSAGIYHKELSLQFKRFIFGNFARIGKKITKSDSLRKFLYWLAREKDYQNANSEMKKSMLNLIKKDLTPILKNIKSKTLIIWGREDKITPLKDGVLMKELIKRSKLKIVDGAKHSPFYTHPKEVVEIIKNDI